MNSIRPPRPKPRQPDGMDIVGDYRKGVSSEEWAQIRDKWQREILRLKTDDEIREWFRVTWIIIGRLIGDHRKALRTSWREASPDVDQQASPDP